MLHYALLAMLIVPAVLAVLPQGFVDRASAMLLGWNGEFSRGGLMLALFVLQALAFLLVRLLLASMPLRLALTPGRTKSRRVHRRAVELFRTGCELKTRGRTGILIYLSLAERRAEILADKAIADQVEPEVWGEAMAAPGRRSEGRPPGRRSRQGGRAGRRGPRPDPAAARRQSQRDLRPAGRAMRPEAEAPEEDPSGKGASSPPSGAANGNMSRAPAASAPPSSSPSTTARSSWSSSIACRSAPGASSFRPA